MLRFVADEHIPGRVVSAIRWLGVDIIRFESVGRTGLPDAAQLAWCMANERVVLTQDKDFVKLGYESDTHCGVAYCHTQKYWKQPGLLAKAVAALAARTPAEVRGSVKFL